MINDGKKILRSIMSSGGVCGKSLNCCRCPITDICTNIILKTLEHPETIKITEAKKMLATITINEALNE